MAIAVETLVVAGVVAQVGGRSSTADCSLGDSGEGRSVVGAVGEGSIAHVVGDRHEGDLAEEASLLEVAVGDVAAGVVGRDQAGLDVGREGQTPEERHPVGVKVHTTHSGLGSIGCAEERRFLGHYLSQVCRPLGQIRSQAGEG